jgi:intracellular sulfur oxidation DsrE/DsrF family protein
MSRNRSDAGWARRAFLSLLGGAAAFGAGAAAPRAQGPEGNWRPSRHGEDDWLDKLPGKHRLFFDTITPDGIGQTLLFATNFFTANKNGYGVEPSDLAVVICLRHSSTAFAFKDAIWQKYSAAIWDRIKWTDPKTNQAATTNLYNSTAYGQSLPNRSNTLDTLSAKGVHFAVCMMATRNLANAFAGKTGGDVETIYKELVANLVSPNAHMVPAGIVAVNRAQERGYALANGG